ncbi:hypothetical protein [Marinomonas gallaica]|uniref:hypothetical protein n=1 Tax=Marinomonas gallaica TaxID=1806667 RepID=UPI003A8D1F21
MSGSFIVTIIIIVTVVLLLAILIMSLLRFYKERQERQQHELEQLSKRSYRVADLLNVLPDRYLPLTTKVVLLEYLISSIHLLSRHKLVVDLEGALPGYLQLLEELKLGQQASINDKVQTHVQLSHVQQGLQSVPLLLRGLVNNDLVDKATAKDQVAQIRFSYCLAHHDLLVKEAQASLELDKKASALEKLRLALVEMEKVATFEQADPVLKKLQNTIQRIETELFGNNSTAS